tara:strand:+ start:273 stop:380 length:108 start_codon:yes stop_codon:yes gene_type:complete
MKEIMEKGNAVKKGSVASKDKYIFFQDLVNNIKYV